MDRLMGVLQTMQTKKKLSSYIEAIRSELHNTEQDYEVQDYLIETLATSPQRLYTQTMNKRK